MTEQLLVDLSALLDEQTERTHPNYEWENWGLYGELHTNFDLTPLTHEELEAIEASKFTQEQCEVNKYELLQQWVHPQLSILRLKERYPNISLSSIVDLSLVYHPIVEVFEPNTLIPIHNIPVDYKLILTNAIKHQNIDVIRYILENLRDDYEQNWNLFMSQDFDLLAESCFLYGYIEPLELVWELFQESITQIFSNYTEDIQGFTPKVVIDRHIHIIKTKLGLPFTKFQPDFYNMNTDPNTLLWTSRTYCEYLVIYTTLRGPNDAFDKLIGRVTPKANYGSYEDNENHLFVIASLLGRRTLLEIIGKYMKEIPQVKVYSEDALKSLYGNSTFDIPLLSKYTDYVSFGILLFNPELAPEYITQTNAQGRVKVNLAAYYLLSGLYDWYISTMLKYPQVIEEGVYLAEIMVFSVSL